MVVETVKDTYEKRIVAFLSRVREACEAAGFAHEDISDSADDEFYWDFCLTWEGEPIGSVCFYDSSGGKALLFRCGMKAACP